MVHFWKDMNMLMDHIAQVEKYAINSYTKILRPTSESGDIVRYGGYSWIVLARDEAGEMLLVASRLLAIMPMKYHHERANVTWEDSSIRKYLNTTFLNKFSAKEQEEIIEKKHINHATPFYDTPGGNATDEKIFLLSLEEIVKYLGDSGQLSKKSWPRENDNDLSKPCLINDEYDNLHSAINEFGEKYHYWLRSPGRDASHAAIVREDGTIDLGGEPVDTLAGIRPAMWVKL